MTENDIILFSVVTILAVNIFVARSKGWQERVWLFVTMQLINLGSGSFMILEGIPQFQADLVIINIMIGLLFFYHVIQNNAMWQRYRREREKKELT